MGIASSANVPRSNFTAGQQVGIDDEGFNVRLAIKQRKINGYYDEYEPCTIAKVLGNERYLVSVPIEGHTFRASDWRNLENKSKSNDTTIKVAIPGNALWAFRRRRLTSSTETLTDRLRHWSRRN